MAEESESSDSKYLSVVVTRHRVGVCVYDELTNTLSVGTMGVLDSDVLRLLEHAYAPKFVTVQSPDEDTLHTAAACFDADVVPAKRIPIAEARRLALLLDLPGMEADCTLAERHLRLGTHFDLQSPIELFPVAIIIQHLLKVRVINELEQSDSPVKITRILELRIEGILIVDLPSLMALQIFKTERHPSAQVQIGNSKEGLSLYGLLNGCKTAFGKRMLKNWLLRPIQDPEMLAGRQTCVQFFTQPENETTARCLVDFLRKIKDVPAVIARVQQYRASPADWLALFKSTIHTLSVIDFCAPHDLPIDIPEGREHLEECICLINNVIDFDASQAEDRVVPKHGLSEELDELKETYEGLGSFLTMFGTEELSRYDTPLVTQMQCFYFPQVGFMVATPVQEDCLAEQREALGTDLQYQFHTETMVYYKNPRVIEIDEHVGDIFGAILDVESGILRQLETRVLQHFDAYSSFIEYLGTLDCLLAFAACAAQYKWVCPILTEENTINITEGRHPLQELCVNTFIPNDTALAAGREGCVQIVTGPNSSGKSVYVKQVALICLLARIGSFVPASAAYIGPIDRIFTRVSSFESTLAKESSFLADLRQMETILSNATEKSLVIVDEFGKGTNANEGVAIFTACVNFLLGSEECPKALFSTHYCDMEAEIMTNSANLRIMRMAHMQEEAEDEAADEVVYLFKLTDVTDDRSPSDSLGFYCARRAGVEEDTVVRAMDVAQQMAAGLTILPIQSQMVAVQAQQKLLELVLSYEEQQDPVAHLARMLRVIQV